jgi:hypothetical protein
MRTRRKPDLLFTLTVFVGLGILVSSYIQHSRANPTLDKVAVPDTKHPVTHQVEPNNPLVLVSNPAHTTPAFHVDNGVVVNNSPKQP